MRRPLLVALPLAVVLLTGCTDQALLDRVAQLETSQDRLRASLTELGAPDPDAAAAADAVSAEVAALSDAVDALQAAIAGVRGDLDAQVLELDGQVTGLELELNGTQSSLAELDAALQLLTDRVASLESQFDAHRGDPFGHGG